jgi:hypothetical protein
MREILEESYEFLIVYGCIPHYLETLLKKIMDGIRVDEIVEVQKEFRNKHFLNVSQTKHVY